MEDVIFDYNKLRGRIREKCLTQEELAKEIGISYVSLSQRLNNKLEFSGQEIYKTCGALEIPLEEIPVYFFTPDVQKHEQPAN